MSVNDTAKALPRIHGVFSCEREVTVEGGGEARTRTATFYVFASEDEGGLNVQGLNRHYIPAGQKTPMSREEFLAEFLPEPELWLNKVGPQMAELEATVNRAEDMRRGGELYSAEFEFRQALTLDEEHVRATFGLGLTYLAQRDEQKAGKVFERLVGMDAAFETQHKHLFNEFGIALRKSGLHDQALAYYGRADTLSQTKDDHLLYNIARTLYEKGEAEEAATRLRQALALNPDFPECRQFLAWLTKGGHIEQPNYDFRL